LLAIALAATLDAPIARAVRSFGLEAFMRQNEPLCEAFKIPGYYGFTLAMVALVAWSHVGGWRAAFFVLTATLASASNQVVRWVFGRTRPFKPPDGSGRLVPFDLSPFPLDSKNLCFPSGHVCLAFATAAALAMLWPRSKWRWVGYAGATLVAVERVVENAHWLSDCVAAAALGIGGSRLIGSLFSKSWKINLSTFRS
jgi:membrane-associated phospholipid phosphatase